MQIGKLSLSLLLLLSLSPFASFSLSLCCCSVLVPLSLPFVCLSPPSPPSFSLSFSPRLSLFISFCHLFPFLLSFLPLSLSLSLPPVSCCCSPNPPACPPPATHRSPPAARRPPPTAPRWSAAAADRHLRVGRGGHLRQTDLQGHLALRRRVPAAQGVPGWLVRRPARRGGGGRGPVGKHNFDIIDSSLTHFDPFLTYDY